MPNTLSKMKLRKCLSSSLSIKHINNYYQNSSDREFSKTALFSGWKYHSLKKSIKSNEYTVYKIYTEKMYLHE